MTHRNWNSYKNLSYVKKKTINQSELRIKASLVMWLIIRACLRYSKVIVSTPIIYKTFQVFVWDNDKIEFSLWTVIGSGTGIHDYTMVFYYEIVKQVFWTENTPNSIYLKRKFTSLFKQSLNLRKALVIIVELEVQFCNLGPSKLL